MQEQQTQTSGYTIDFKELSYGDHSFKFVADKRLFEPYPECEVLDGSCNVSVNMQRSESMLLLEVDISGEVECECDRCLEPCGVEIDFYAPLIVKFSDQEELEGEYDGEVMWLPTSTATLDLAHYIYESIILSLPYQRVHQEGDCDQEMLEKFRIVSSAEFQKIEQECEESDNETLPAEELAKLEALKAKMMK